MYYVNLGLKGLKDTSGVDQADFGVFGNGTRSGTDNSSFGLKDAGLVRNLQSFAYWSGTAYAPNPTQYAWYFVTVDGYQSLNVQNGDLYAWAVRPGDVAAVPEPEVYALLIAGLGLLGVAAKRRRRSFGVS
jgi:hypothetical protein